MWGLFPLYWPLLKPLGALELLAHRVVWSLVVLVVWLVAARKLRWMRQVPAAKLGGLALASVLISCNWLLYIWAVNTGHVVETSLGYFINPLMSVALGVVVLGERLRRAQAVALALAAVAVLVLTADYGHLPYIALGLAPTFALYGLVKKRVALGAVESLSFETALLALPALAYLGWLHAAGEDGAQALSPLRVMLLLGAGPATVLPLVCFGAAANRVPLRTLGLLQYVAPSMQFLIGVVVFREAMSPGRWLGFSLIWLALVWFVAEGLWVARRRAVAHQNA